MTTENKKALEGVIGRYFDASYEGRGEEMLQVFHPSAHIYGRRDGGDLIDWPIETFARLVSSEPGPASEGLAREDEICSLTFTGPETAVAVVKLRLFDTRYTDVLSFLFIEGRWQIIAKMLASEKVD